LELMQASNQSRCTQHFSEAKELHGVVMARPGQLASRPKRETEFV